jgi:Tol biopolymer transport system component
MWSKWFNPGRACRVLLACAVPIAACNELVSVGQNSAPGDGDSLNARLSADGHLVAFDSAASNLVANDTNGGFDVFVRARSSLSTERVSVRNDGSEAVCCSVTPDISDDGRFVVFASNSSDFVPAGTVGVLLRDRVLGTTTFLGEGRRPTLSADGRWAAFLQRTMSVKIPGQVAQISVGRPVLLNLQTGELDTSLVLRTDLIPRTAADLSFSADGQFLAFSDYVFTGDAVDGASAASAAVRVFDRTLRVLDVVADGGPGKFSQRPSLSADGRIVAFDSLDGSLVVGDTNGLFDAFVRDRAAGMTTRISVSDSGAQSNGGSGFTSISADGDRVVFASFASNLVAGDSNGLLDTFVHVRSRALTRRIAIADNGDPGNGMSSSAAISANGNFSVYTSTATNLSGFVDTGTTFDIFGKSVDEVLPQPQPPAQE